MSALLFDLLEIQPIEIHTETNNCHADHGNNPLDTVLCRPTVDEKPCRQEDSTQGKHQESNFRLCRSRPILVSDGLLDCLIT